MARWGGFLLMFFALAQGAEASNPSVSGTAKAIEMEVHEAVVFEPVEGSFSLAAGSGWSATVHRGRLWEIREEANLTHARRVLWDSEAEAVATFAVDEPARGRIRLFAGTTLGPATSLATEAASIMRLVRDPSPAASGTPHVALQIRGELTVKASFVIELEDGILSFAIEKGTPKGERAGDWQESRKFPEDGSPGLQDRLVDVHRRLLLEVAEGYLRVESATLGAAEFSTPRWPLYAAGAARLTSFRGAAGEGPAQDRGLSGTLQFETVPDLVDADRVVIRIWGAPEGGAGPAPQVPVLATTLAGMAVVGLGLVLFPRLRLVVARLYARLRRDRVETHPLRSALLDLARSDPGIGIAETARRLGANPFTVQYHVEILVREGLLSAPRHGRHRRLFIPGSANHSDWKALGLLHDDSSRRLVELLGSQPCIGVREAGRRLQMSPASVAWSLRRLVAAGLVSREAEGYRVRLPSLSAGAPAAGAKRGASA